MNASRIKVSIANANLTDTQILLETTLTLSFAYAHTIRQLLPQKLILQRRIYECYCKQHQELKETSCGGWTMMAFLFDTRDAYLTMRRLFQDFSRPPFLLLTLCVQVIEVYSSLTICVQPNQQALHHTLILISPYASINSVSNLSISEHAALVVL